MKIDKEKLAVRGVSLAILIVAALFWFAPLMVGLARAFSCDDDLETVQGMYIAWWFFMVDLVAQVRTGVPV